MAAVTGGKDTSDKAPVEMARFTLRGPAALARFIAPTGSVALDGVSLTVNAGEVHAIMAPSHP